MASLQPNGAYGFLSFLVFVVCLLDFGGGVFSLLFGSGVFFLSGVELVMQGFLGFGGGVFPLLFGLGVFFLLGVEPVM